MTIQEAPSSLQAVRCIYDNGRPLTASDIIHIMCHPDPTSGRDILLWGDIKAAFDDVLHVRSGTVLQSFLRGPDFKILDPLRIGSVPGVTLDIVVRGRLVRAVASSQQEPSIMSPSQELSVESLQQTLPNNADEGTNTSSHTSDSNTVTTTTATSRDPVYGLENTAMDNYTHIDTPDDIRALTMAMILGRYQEQVSANINTSVATVTASVPRDPAYGLENVAMDAYRNNDNPAFAPPTRDPHANPDDQSLPTVNNNSNTPPNSHNSGFETQRLRAPQESASDATEDFAKTMANARLGDNKSLVALGDMYRDGRGVRQDYKAAMNRYKKAADMGYADAQCNIGQLYYNGQGVTCDYSAAYRWYTLAAEQGYARAIHLLGILYSWGRGLPYKGARDFGQAARYYLKAANQGYAPAQCDLGWLHQLGLGVNQDYSLAMEWYLKASDQGHADSQYKVGYLYHQGFGVAQDHSQAMEWYLRAAEKGHATAQASAGVMYQHGQGVPQDEALALDWYRKAAVQGNANAQFNLGLTYEYGMGVPLDREEAVKWYKKAADGGDADAKEKLEELEHQGDGVESKKQQTSV